VVAFSDLGAFWKEERPLSSEFNTLKESSFVIIFFALWYHPADESYPYRGAAFIGSCFLWQGQRHWASVSKRLAGANAARLAASSRTTYEDPRIQ
jgi:hypothetical protein